jgi:hypothetical protein
MYSYIRTARAAVAAASSQQDEGQHVSRNAALSSGPTQTLWASRPLTLRAGRLVAVKLRGDDLRVGLTTENGLRWVRPEAVLTTAQAEAWTRTSTFSPDRRPR